MIITKKIELMIMLMIIMIKMSMISMILTMMMALDDVIKNNVANNYAI